jgi:hypothetical protein
MVYCEVLVSLRIAGWEVCYGLTTGREKFPYCLRQRKSHADDFATELYRWLETLCGGGAGIGFGQS